LVLQELRANSWAAWGEFGAMPQTPKTKTRSVLIPLARAKAFGFRLSKNGLPAVFEL
jgi:hypothetical protein